MKIMFVIPTLGNGGAERVITNLANNLCKDNNIEIFTLEKSKIDKYELLPQVEIKELGINVKHGKINKVIFKYLFSFLKQKNALRMEINVFKPDFLISFLPKADYIVSKLANKFNFKWISSERNDPLSRNKFFQFILLRAYRKTDFFICQTKKIYDYYKNKGLINVQLIPNPVNIFPSFNSNFDVIKDDYAIAIGRLDKQKNYIMLVNAFYNATRISNNSLKLIILGDGPEKEKIEEAIIKLKCNNVFLLGRKNNVNDYIYKAKFYIISSLYEGLPNSMLEAMALSKPIISTNYYSGAALDYISSENGIIVPNNNEQEMTKALILMMNKTNEELEIMGKNSRKKVVDLSSENIIIKWKKIFDL